MSTQPPEQPVQPDDPNGQPHYRPYWQQVVIVLLLLAGMVGSIIGGVYGLHWLLEYIKK